MALIQVGLVDQTGEIDPQLIQETAAALNSQVVHDLPQYWTVQAAVQYLSSPKHIPPGVWPVYLVKELPPGEGGFHLDKHNQPYSKVIASPSSEEWTIDASHETIEMLVDPAGNRMTTSIGIKIQGDDVVDDRSKEFNYLVEAADPCEADDFTYQIQGISVSDFITPHFYDPASAPGVKYSFTGAIKRPRQILKGGYISFVDMSTEEWGQILWVDPSKPPQYNSLGPATSVRSNREWVDAQMGKHRASAQRNPAVLEASRQRRQLLRELARKRAETIFR